MIVRIKDKSHIIKSHDVIMFLLIVSGFAFDDIPYVDLIIQAIAFAYTAVVLFTRKQIMGRVSKYALWLVLFSVYSFISSAWASSSNSTALRCSASVVQAGLLGITVLVYLDDEKRLLRLIRFYIGSAYIIVIRFFIEVPTSFWGKQARIVDESIFGGNETAVILSYAACIVAWRTMIDKEKTFKTLFFKVVTIALFLLVDIFMGTKSGLLIFAIGTGVLIIGKTNNPIKIIFRIAIIVSLLFLFFYAMMNIPILYNSIGYRMEFMINTITGKGIGDASTMMRMKFVDDAFNVFKNHPIVGVGQDGFRYVNRYEFTYSHNNYVEILANLGIIGFVIYYSRFVKYIRDAILVRRITTLPIMLLVILLVVDFTGVTYSLENPYILTSLVIGNLYLIKLQKEGNAYGNDK